MFSYVNHQELAFGGRVLETLQESCILQHPAGVHTQGAY